MIGVHACIVSRVTVPLFTQIFDSTNCCVDFWTKRFCVHCDFCSADFYVFRSKVTSGNSFQSVVVILCHPSTVIICHFYLGCYFFKRAFPSLPFVKVAKIIKNKTWLITSIALAKGEGRVEFFITTTKRERTAVL